MKKSIPFLLLYLLIFAISTGAQNEQSFSLIWKVSGKKLSEPGYLFGTMHVNDEQIFFMEDLVKKYIDQCQVFALEVLIDEVTPKKMEKHLFMKNINLKELLSPEEYFMVDQYLKNKLGIGLLFFNKMKPFFLSTQLLQAGLTQNSRMPLDIELQKYSKETGKKVIGLEKFEDQIRAVDKISLHEQAQMLVKTVSDTIIDIESYRKMIDAYVRQDIEQLYALTISDTSESDHFHKVFIVNRNKKMTRKMINILKKQSAFFAVGAAHLGGPDGIIELLRKKGYQVEQVY